MLYPFLPLFSIHKVHVTEITLFSEGLFNAVTAGLYNSASTDFIIL